MGALPPTAAAPRYVCEGASASCCDSPAQQHNVTERLLPSTFPHSCVGGFSHIQVSHTEPPAPTHTDTCPHQLLIISLPVGLGGTEAPETSTQCPSLALRSAQPCAAPGWTPPWRPAGTAGPSQDAGNSSGSPSNLKHTCAERRSPKVGSSVNANQPTVLKLCRTSASILI